MTQKPQITLSVIGSKFFLLRSVSEYSVSGPFTDYVKGISITYLLTPWSTVLLEKLTSSAASQEIPRIFGTRRFITVLTSARDLSLSWANSIQFPQPPPTSWRSILISSSHLRLGLPNDLFSSGFPTRTLCTLLPSPIRATCLAHLTTKISMTTMRTSVVAKTRVAFDLRIQKFRHKRYKRVFSFLKKLCNLTV